MTTYTTDTLDAEWLEALNGRTVSQAITYLQTFPPDAKLVAAEDNEGYLNRTWLTHRRPRTEAEMLDFQRRQIRESIVRENDLIRRFSPPSDPERRAAMLAQAQANLERYQAELKKLAE